MINMNYFNQALGFLRENAGRLTQIEQFAEERARSVIQDGVTEAQVLLEKVSQNEVDVPQLLLEKVGKNELNTFNKSRSKPQVGKNEVDEKLADEELADEELADEELADEELDDDDDGIDEVKKNKIKPLIIMSENIKEPLLSQNENTPEPEINIDDILKPEIEAESYKNWIKEFTVEKARDILKSGQTGNAFFRAGHVIQNEYFEEMAKQYFS